MIVKSKQYRLKVNVFAFFTRSITDPELENVDLLCVEVEGECFDIITSGIPTSGQVLWTSYQGRLRFTTEIPIRAKVFVIYQH